MLEKLFFVQERVGKEGRPLKVVKFRTMDGERCIDEDVIRRRFSGEQVEAHRTKLMGVLLRYLGIDELPQVINLLRGEMNIIGIRPKLEEEMSLLPDDIREFYLAHGPGFFPPQPAANLDEKLEALRELIRFVNTLKTMEAQGRTIARFIYATHYLGLQCAARLSDPMHVSVIREKTREAIGTLV